MWQIWTCAFGFLVTVTPSVTTGGQQNDAASSRSLKSTHCTLPANPEHGTFDIIYSNINTASTYNDTLLLSVSCHHPYGIEGRPYGEKTVVLCAQGIWYQTIPKCVRFCKLDPALEPSVDYICNQPDNGIRPCGGFLAPGTVVNPVCKTPYYSSEILANMECIYGQWSYMAKCKAECGRAISEGGDGLIVSGTDATHGQVPWHVGIYRRTSTPYEQICGGTIVTNNVVISAAHCFWNSVRNEAFPPSRFIVVGGKIYRQWANKLDVNAQKSNVKEIKIPSLYQGAVGHFGVDIAGLILGDPFVYNLFVRPVCLNFDSNYERWQLQHGKLGKAAGWGLTRANGNYSPILQVVDLPFINDEICLTTVPQHFRPYITGDKFCAGYTNGTALCQGDSGGGLSFPDKEQGKDRFYFRGVVSTAPRTDDNDKCNDHTYTAFTKIAIHQDFIRSVITVSEQRTCQGAECSVVNLGYPFIGEDPLWNGFGTILTNKFILTSANKTSTNYPWLSWPVNLRFVTVKVYNADSYNADYRPFHIVKRIHLHPVYKERLLNSDSYYFDDIALLELETPITFSTDVFPACLPEPSQDDESAKYFDNHSKDVTKISTEACDAFLKEDREGYQQKTKNESQLCYTKHSSFGFWDAPLIVTTQQSHCRNTVIGIKSWRLSNYVAVFTKVEHYIPWIMSIVGS